MVHVHPTTPLILMLSVMRCRNELPQNLAPTLSKPNIIVRDAQMNMVAIVPLDIDAFHRIGPSVTRDGLLCISYHGIESSQHI